MKISTADQLDMTTCWICKEGFQKHTDLRAHLILKHFLDQLKAKIHEELGISRINHKKIQTEILEQEQVRRN